MLDLADTKRPPIAISVDRSGSAAWLRAAAVVRSRYRASFDADVLPSPDYFISLSRGTGPGRPEPEVLACAGMTNAPEGGFFSERYLDAPIEELIAARTGAACTRDELVEIGSLASESRLAGLELVRFLPIVTSCHAKRFALVTVTGQLDVLLRRVGIEFHPITEASASRLAAGDHERWGSYYATAPTTGYIVVADALAAEGTHGFASVRLDRADGRDDVRAVS